VARAPACRAGGHGFESRRGRLGHGGPWGISSVGRAPALQAGGQGFDSPILHSHNISGGVAERYCSSLLASRRVTRGWGFESLRLRNGQQPVPWRSWCSGNTVVCDSTIDGFNSLRSPKCPCSATDSAPVSGTGGCVFESCRGYSRNATSPCSSTERVPVYEAEDGSSILSRGTQAKQKRLARAARVAQRTERRFPKPDGVGSNPAVGTSRHGRSQDAPAPGARMVSAARL
jgi:hypothetical protein